MTRREKKLADYIREAISELEDTQDLLREARGALFAEQETSSPWHPIETAPKDGTRIILYAPESGFGMGRVGEGSWAASSWNWSSESFYMWGEEVSDPTHWMPLPNPPSP